VQAYRIVRCRGSLIVYTIVSEMAVRLSALCSGRTLLPERFGTYFCYRLSKPQGYGATGRTRYIEKNS
jgi:hypothetical protein